VARCSQPISDGRRHLGIRRLRLVSTNDFAIGDLCGLFARVPLLQAREVLPLAEPLHPSKASPRQQNNLVETDCRLFPSSLGHGSCTAQGGWGSWTLVCEHARHRPWTSCAHATAAVPAVAFIHHIRHRETGIPAHRVYTASEKAAWSSRKRMKIFFESASTFSAANAVTFELEVNQDKATTSSHPQLYAPCAKTDNDEFGHLGHWVWALRSSAPISEATAWVGAEGYRAHVIQETMFGVMRWPSSLGFSLCSSRANVKERGRA